MALNPGANQYTVAGNTTTSVNKGSWAGPMSGLILLYVYDATSLHYLWQ